jgi:hypothetical protein
MIVTDKDAAVRLASPLNLINQLRESKSSRKDAMSLFGIGRKSEPLKIEQRSEAAANLSAIASPKESDDPSLDNLIQNSEAQIQLGQAHDTALKLLNSSVAILSAKLDDVKAEKLPAVIIATSKVVESIRRERSEASKNNKDREVHYHFYTPNQKSLSDYEVIDVAAIP